MTLNLPYKWILFWRGDVVHAGGLGGDIESGCPRLHGYVAMQESHTKIIPALGRQIHVKDEEGELSETIANLCFFRDEITA